MCNNLKSPVLKESRGPRQPVHILRKNPKILYAVWVFGANVWYEFCKQYFLDG